MNRLRLLFLFVLIPYLHLLDARIEFPPFSDDAYIPGHSLLITKNVEETTYWKYELLKHAKKTIEISGSYAAGNPLAQVIEILREKLAENPELRVHFLLAYLSLLNSEEEIKELKELAALYPNQFFIVYRVPIFSMQNKGIYTSENHIKLLVIDEKYFVMGGTSLTNHLCQSYADNYEKPDSFLKSFVPGASSDMDVVGAGPITQTLRKEFFQLYELIKNEKNFNHTAGHYETDEMGYVPIENPDDTYLESLETHPEYLRDVPVQIFLSGPRRELHTSGAVYYHLIQKAKRKIDLGQLYFFPVKEIYEKLVQAASENISISLITNGIRPDAMKTTYFYGSMNRYRYAPLMFGRTFKLFEKKMAKTLPLKPTRIYEFKRHNAVYHKKVMVIDDRYCVIGSYNLGKKSEYADYELTMVIDSEAAAKKFLDVLETDKIESKEISAAEAINWHFNMLYYISQRLERLFVDGIQANKEFAPFLHEESDCDFNWRDALPKHMPFP